MREHFRMTVEQCDGSVKVYNERPWWLDVPVSGQSFRSASNKIRKADKISNAMTQIAEIKRETYIDSLLAKGIVVRKNEQGLVVIREVAEKLRRE